MHVKFQTVIKYTDNLKTMFKTKILSTMTKKNTPYG